MKIKIKWKEGLLNAALAIIEYQKSHSYGYDIVRSYFIWKIIQIDNFHLNTVFLKSRCYAALMPLTKVIYARTKGRTD